MSLIKTGNFCLTLLILSISCSVGRFQKISKKIDRERNYTGYKYASPYFHPFRMKLFKNGELDFINWKNDTVYLLEAFLTESSPTISGTIWNKKNLLNYTFAGFIERIIPPYQIVDSSLLSFLNTGNEEIKDFYKSQPEHTVKNRYYFEKIILNEKEIRIVDKVTFGY